MELRSSRSRSKTPTMLSNTLEGDVVSKQISKKQTRITRSSIKKSSSSEEKLKNNNSGSSSFIQKKIITSDYSSEDGENEVSSSHHLNENTRNEYLERKNNGNSASAYKIYKEARKYWDHYPKTDYTYSPHSKDRVEIAPGIINMPNMSRKSIHDMCEIESCSKETNTTILDYPQQVKLRPRALFSDNNNRHEYSNKNTIYNQSHTVISYFFELIQITVMTLVTIFTRVFEKPHKWITSIMKILHKITSKIMLLDSWILQGQHTEKYSKIKAVLALCLVPLLFLAGLWCVSALSELLPPWKSASIVIPTEEDRSLQSIENIIKIRLDSPYAIGLSHDQIKQIAYNLKYSLNLKENEDTITKLILNDPKLVQLSSTPIKQENKEDIENIIIKLLESEKFQKVLKKHDANFEDISKDLKFEIDSLKNDLHSDQTENLKSFLKLRHENQRCCRRSFIGIEKHIEDVFKVLISKDDFKENYLTWFKTIFIVKEELEERLMASNLKLKDEFNSLFENNAKHIMDTVALELSSKLATDNNYKSERKLLTDEDYIKTLISEAIDKYDADKTGLVDFALESAGGQVLSTRCTESYTVSTAVISIFGIPVWYPTHGPRTVINSKVVPGECWAFKKFPGYLVVQLSTNVEIEAFSYEHVNKKLVANGKIDSAPKHMSIYGLRSEDDKDPSLIGEYTYDILGDPLQFFPAQNRGLTFNIVQLVVNSNHGNNNYTCLYRFRVHGKLNQEPTAE